MTACSSNRPARLVCVLAAGVAAGAVLSGCAEDGGGQEAAATGSSPAAASSSAGAGTDLTPGLLPAEAFGADAQVTPVTEQQLAQGAMAATGSMAGAQITPEACAAAVKGTQPQVDQFDDLAAQVAVRGTTTTVELLSLGGPVDDAVSQLTEQIADCPEAQVSSPEIGTATITFTEIDVPDVGDDAAGVSFTTVATTPGGAQVTVPSLIGLVRDGDRLVTLVATDPKGGPLDEAAFTALLQQAHDVQAEQLD
ncbi:hypothetical protein ACI79C_02270 [Geodermatophilus sp. SYSU D00697]